jgi:hypothetical protein
MIGGLGIEKTYWNTKTGRPAVIQIDPRDFLIDPECMSNNIYDGNASFVVWKKKMDADRLRRVYGLSKQGTKKVIGEAAAFEEASIIDDDGLYKRYEYANVFRDPHPGTADYNRPMVTVYEFWYFEDAVPGLESTEDDVKLSMSRPCVVSRWRSTSCSRRRCRWLSSWRTVSGCMRRAR